MKKPRCWFWVLALWPSISCSSQQAFDDALNLWAGGNLSGASQLAEERINELSTAESAALANGSFWGWQPWQRHLLVRERSRLMAVGAFALAAKNDDALSAARLMIRAVQGLGISAGTNDATTASHGRLFVSTQPDSLTWKYAQELELRLRRVVEHSWATTGIAAKAHLPPPFNFLLASGWWQYGTPDDESSFEPPRWGVWPPLWLKPKSNETDATSHSRRDGAPRRSGDLKTVPEDSQLVFDAMIPCHAKDASMLPLTIRWLWRHTHGGSGRSSRLGTIWIVTESATLVNSTRQQLLQQGVYGAKDEKTKPSIQWVPEAAFPLNRQALRGDVYQQLLKLLFLQVVPAARDHTLVCDADVLWLRPVDFLASVQQYAPSSSSLSTTHLHSHAAGETDSNHANLDAVCHGGGVQALVATSSSHASWDVLRSTDGGIGYPEFVERMLGVPKASGPGSTAIAHHMMLHRGTLNALFHFVADRFVGRRSTYRADGSGANKRCQESFHDFPSPPTSPSSLPSPSSIWSSLWDNFLSSRATIPTNGPDLACNTSDAEEGATLIVPEAFAADERVLLSSWEASSLFSSSNGSKLQPWRLPGNEWIVFVEVLRVLSKPRPSEYELYHTFASYYRPSKYDNAIYLCEDKITQGSSSTLSRSPTPLPSSTREKESNSEEKAARSSPASIIRERPLKWDDWGTCCFDEAGSHITRQRAARALHNSAQTKDSPTLDHSMVAATAERLRGDWCDLEVMHDELARHFDYITCHRHLRPKMANIPVGIVDSPK